MFVTSTSTQVPVETPPISAIASPVDAGFVDQVMPCSVQPVVVGVTMGPSIVPDVAHRRSAACRTVPLNPDSVKERYVSTWVPVPPSTRSGLTVPKFVEGFASSTRASAVGPTVTAWPGVVALAAALDPDLLPPRSSATTRYEYVVPGATVVSEKVVEAPIVVSTDPSRLIS